MCFRTWGHRGHAEHGGRREDQQFRQVEDVENQSGGFRDGALAAARGAKQILTKHSWVFPTAPHLNPTRSARVCVCSYQPEADFCSTSDALSSRFLPAAQDGKP